MHLLVEASSIFGGGGLAHLKALVENFSPGERMASLEVWGQEQLLSRLPKNSSVSFRSHAYLNKKLWHRTYWQNIIFPQWANTKKGAIVLSLSGLGCHRHKNKVIGLCHNQLPFEWSEIWAERFLSPHQRRLLMLRYGLKKSLSRCEGLIFLSENSKERVVPQLSAAEKKLRVIPHGIHDGYRLGAREQKPMSFYNANHPFCFLYVSTVFRYKHQDIVARAIAQLRQKNLPVSARFVGGGDPREIAALHRLMHKIDPRGEFLEHIGDIPGDRLLGFYQKADAFVYASTCETFGCVLVEAMASGLPVACSDQRPMRDIANDAAIYFNPRSVESCAKSLESLLLQEQLREELTRLGPEVSLKYSWSRCAKETFQFIFELAL